MNTLISLVLALLMTLLGALSPKEAGAHWVRIPGEWDEGMYCLAASEDETCFLLGKNIGTTKAGLEFSFAVYNAETGKRTPLFLSDKGDRETVTARLQERLEEKGSVAFPEQYGGIDGYAIRYLWQAVPTVTDQRGDLLLLSHGNGYALVDLRTGETTVLDCRSASITGDGRVLASYVTGASLLDPSTGQTLPAPMPLGTAFEEDAALCAAQMLSDGSLLSEVVFTLQTRVQNKSMRDMALVFWGADGSPQQTLPLGGIQLGQEPDRLFYSESLETGIAFSIRYIMSRYPFIFRRGDETVRFLQLESVDAPYAVALDPAEAADEIGNLVTPSACALFPYGISRDGQSVLCVDLKSGYLLEIRLDTLAARVVLTEAETSALAREKNPNLRPFDVFTNMRWNGANLFVGRSCPPGYALLIPLFP